jgi:hypothetical protein
MDQELLPLPVAGAREPLHLKTKGPEFGAFRLLCAALNGLCKTRLLAGRGVLLDDAALCRLIDRLICLREGLTSIIRVRRNELLHALRGIRERALPADIEDPLLEGCAVRLLC